MYVCNCHGVTEKDLIALVDNSECVFQFANIATHLRASKSCCKCLPETREIIDEAQLKKTERNSGSWVG